jgi:hypothetical protein
MKVLATLTALWKPVKISTRVSEKFEDVNINIFSTKRSLWKLWKISNL